MFPESGDFLKTKQKMNKLYRFQKKRRIKINIGTKKVGENEPVFIIAEIGSNHDGKLSQAKKLIQAAAGAGVDAVKFQSFKAETLLNKLKLDSSGKWIKNRAFEKLKELEFPKAWHLKLKKFAEKKGVIFLSTPFDEERADLLNRIGVKAFKIASGDLTSHPFLRYIARFKKPIILSTGMATLQEVKEAVRVVQEEGNNQIVLLHCVSVYPPQFSDANVRAMVEMRKKLNLPVGYSDHTPGAVVPLAAVTLGACVIEKHITFDRSLKGPDHPFAMTVEEFAALVLNIRDLGQALGNGKKQPVPSEIPERIWARRGIYATKDIPKGTVISKGMLKIVRPCLGIQSKETEKVLGKTSKIKLRADYPLRWEHLQ